MKTGYIIRGLILIFLGSVILLDNLNIIDFYWSSVWRFWPVIFILIGVNMLVSRMKNKQLAPILVASITVLILGIIGYQGLKPNDTSWVILKDGKNKPKLSYKKAYFIESYQGSKNVELNIAGAAGNFDLRDTTQSLFEAEVSQSIGNYSLKRTKNDSLEVLNFKMRDGQSSLNLNDLDQIRTEISLNQAPIWDLNLSMGAGSIDFDLTPYKVKSLKFEGGAASLEAKIGNKQELTNVSVEAGAASIKIEVPKESGCRIELADVAISSNNFSDFIKKADGSYETSNYSTSINKVNITFKGAVSSFKVNRY